MSIRRNEPKKPDGDIGGGVVKLDNAAAIDAGKRLFDIVENGDLDDLLEIFSPDAMVWHNTDDSLTDIPTTIRNLHSIRDSAVEFRYDDIRRIPTADGFVQQHTLIVRMPDGRAIRDLCCCICTVEHGRITRMEAYHDSAATSAMAHKANRKEQK